MRRDDLPRRLRGPVPPVLSTALGSLSVQELAKLVGTSPSTVYSWLEGHALPASKRRWLDRWNRSPADVREAMKVWVTL